jgi:hypothetical protein
LNFVIIAISFIVSTILSLFIMRNKKSRWLAGLSAFVINTTILGLTYWFMYNLNEESRLFGIDFHNRYVLVVFIPLLTWINLIILSFKGIRGVSA